MAVRMRIFISWSGKASLAVATALKEWLPYIFNGIELFVSSEDIRKGKRWPAEISKELDQCNFGIVCLTSDNLQAPWILFESGALSKSVKSASVFTLVLGGLRPVDIEGPLSHFQHTVFEKEDFFKLIKSINEGLETGKQEPTRLRTIFNKFWDDLNSTVTTVVTAQSKPHKERSMEDMLRELLETTRYIARNIPDARQVSGSAEQSRGQSPEGFWPEFLERIAKSSPFARSYLSEGNGYVENGTLNILFDREFEDHIGLVDNARNRGLFERVLMEMGFPKPTSIVIKPQAKVEQSKPRSGVKPAS